MSLASIIRLIIFSCSPLSFPLVCVACPHWRRATSGWPCGCWTFPAPSASRPVWPSSSRYPQWLTRSGLMSCFGLKRSFATLNVYPFFISTHVTHVIIYDCGGGRSKLSFLDTGSIFSPPCVEHVFFYFYPNAWVQDWFRRDGPEAKPRSQHAVLVTLMVVIPECEYPQRKATSKEA